MGKHQGFVENICDISMDGIGIWEFLHVQFFQYRDAMLWTGPSKGMEIVRVQAWRTFKASPWGSYGFLRVLSALVYLAGTNRMGKKQKRSGFLFHFAMYLHRKILLGYMDDL